MSAHDDPAASGVAASRMAELSPGSMFNGRYRIVRVLGAGGMGVVYRVLDTNTERERALKVMLPTVVSNAELRSRFAREAKIAAKIDSEHIAEVLDAGIEAASGAPFIVMELLKGEELERLVLQRGSLPADEALLYLSQAALALDKAHAQGIVHRDLKPENLYVTYRDDGSPRIKLLDFGIAKVVSASMSGSETKGMLGTPIFMAPEQAHGEVAISARTDTYALAHIAYVLLVGEPYFEAENQDTQSIYHLIVAIMKGPAESACARAWRRKNIALPPAFDPWFARATARDPTLRFERASELVQALGQALGVPVSLRPSSTPMPPITGPQAVMSAPPPSPGVPTAGSQPWPGPPGAQGSVMPGSVMPGSVMPGSVMPGPVMPGSVAPSTLGSPGPHYPPRTVPESPALDTFSVAHAPTVSSSTPALRPGLSTRAALMIGGALFLVLTAGGSVLVLRGGGDVRSQDTVQDTKRRRDVDDDGNQRGAAPTPPPSSTGPAPGVQGLALVGSWRSDSGRVYDARWDNGRVEFHIREGRQLGEGWKDDEVRFALVPNEDDASAFRVMDHIRAKPPPGHSYASADAPENCTRVYEMVGGQTLGARVDGDRLEVNMVEAKFEMKHFEWRDGKATGCKDLDTAATRGIVSRLERQR